jgi:hypothetical protein
VLRLLRTPSLEDGFTSADAIFDALRSGEVLLMLLVALYVVWYMNRAPARAFYRGYYLKREE